MKLAIVYTGVYNMIDFEWDESKNQNNIRKHGIDFNDAGLIFSNFTWKWLDRRYVYGEVRKANQHERQIYEEKIKQKNTN